MLLVRQCANINIKRNFQNMITHSKIKLVKIYSDVALRL